MCTHYVQTATYTEQKIHQKKFTNSNLGTLQAEKQIQFIHSSHWLCDLDEPLCLFMLIQWTHYWVHFWNGTQAHLPASLVSRCRLNDTEINWNSTGDISQVAVREYEIAPWWDGDFPSLVYHWENQISPLGWIPMKFCSWQSLWVDLGNWHQMTYL